MRNFLARCFGVFLAVALLCGPAHMAVQTAAAAQAPHHHCPEMDAMAAHSSTGADHGQTGLDKNRNSGKDQHSAVPPCCAGVSMVIAIAVDSVRISVPAFGSTAVAYHTLSFTVSGLTLPPDLDPPRSNA
jgi:uncharacterized protein involved in copper resistance